MSGVAVISRKGWSTRTVAVLKQRSAHIMPSVTVSFGVPVPLPVCPPPDWKPIPEVLPSAPHPHPPVTSSPRSIESLLKENAQRDPASAILSWVAESATPVSAMEVYGSPSENVLSFCELGPTPPPP